MDKWQGINSFWSGFGVDAYDESSVPDDAGYPRITYNVVVDSLDQPVSMYASLWYKSHSWVEISQMANTIGQAIDNMRTPIKIDGGYLWIVRGTPFAQRMSDPEDDLIRRININIRAEYLTAH